MQFLANAMIDDGVEYKESVSPRKGTPNSSERVLISQIIPTNFEL